MARGEEQILCRGEGLLPRLSGDAGRLTPSEPMDAVPPALAVVVDMVDAAVLAVAVRWRMAGNLPVAHLLREHCRAHCALRTDDDDARLGKSASSMSSLLPLDDM